MEELRTGFSSPEIEQAAISAMMQWPEESFMQVDSLGITVEHFYTPANQTLFAALKNFWIAGKPIELISFTNELRNLGFLDRVGGAYYVTQTWCNTCYSPVAFDYYLEIIEESHAKRLLLATCQRSITDAETLGTEGEPLVAQTIETLEQIPLPSRHKNRERTLAEMATDKLERLLSGAPAEDLISTGLKDLDFYSPLRRGDMPLIAGVRKAGKSILALNIALNVSRRNIGVLYFSLEDREPKMMDRILANTARHSLSTSGSNLKIVNELNEAVEKIKSLPFHIRDDVFELVRIVAISKELKARKDIGLIVVDYGQLVVAPERKDSNREQKVAEVSRTLRLLAMELDTPLILLSQLNDAGLTRESRALEQDATAMWRVDLVETEGRKKNDPITYESNLRSVIVPWQRNGESGVGFKIVFIGEQARIENYTHEETF